MMLPQARVCVQFCPWRKGTWAAMCDALQETPLLEAFQRGIEQSNRIASQKGAVCLKELLPATWTCETQNSHTRMAPWYCASTVVCSRIARDRIIACK